VLCVVVWGLFWTVVVALALVVVAAVLTAPYEAAQSVLHTVVVSVQGSRKGGVPSHNPKFLVANLMPMVKTYRLASSCHVALHPIPIHQD